MDSYSPTIKHYCQVRKATEDICSPLETEDYVIQGMEDVSPPKWHLAHTTWFFETFILIPYLKGYKPFNPLFQYLFNSYYQTLGTPFPRPNRGTLSRPSVRTIYQYRAYVDECLLAFLNQGTAENFNDIQALLILGLNHEQQHQELLYMDIKYNLFLNPEFPVYKTSNRPLSAAPKETFIYNEQSIADIGFQGTSFCFDNETPVNQQLIRPFLIANRLVTNKEYLEFISDNGYKNPIFWLSDGWDCVLKNKWEAPLYWINHDGRWSIFTLNGLEAINPDEPVCHVSFYEACAYANWRNKRLASEFEWEHFVNKNALSPEHSNFMENDLLHPTASSTQEDTPQQFFGDVWEWTLSPYAPYPGYKPFMGNLKEYNAKFMCNQLVLRGGCCVTPSSHIRPSYRNFFQPEKRWQFSGIRLAWDGD